MKRACTTGRWDRLFLVALVTILDYRIKDVIYIFVFIRGLFEDKFVTFLCSSVFGIERTDFKEG